MKFISFLYPYPIRNVEAPHIWSLYKQLEHISPEDLFCIGSEDYFSGPEYFKNAQRWEVNWSLKGWEKSKGIKQKYIVDPDIFIPLNQDLLTPNRVWASLINEIYEPLVYVLDQYFKEITSQQNIDAVFALCNCASLSHVARKYNIPVIHVELGALRAPHYINTAYFDFSGVNGDTEAEKRYQTFSQELELSPNSVELLSRSELLNFVRNHSNKNEKKQPLLKKMRREIRSFLRRCPSNEFKIGLPLQVEDDSNMLAYSNGFNNIELLNYTYKFFDKSDVLVRKHPGGHAIYKVQNNDESIFPFAFIERCQSIVTINSSMGLEALLLGKPAWIMGQNPFKFCASQSASLNQYIEAPDLEKCLNFCIFSYLVPFDVLFDPEYLKFRLNNPSEIDIYNNHMQYWKS